MTTPKPEFYLEDTDDQPEYRWRLKAGNGEIVIPPEGHTSHRDALRAFVDTVEAVLSWVNENTDDGDTSTGALTAAARRSAQ